MITTVIIFLIVLAVLIVSHELGHFMVAKFFGLRVDEFGLGFPPRLFQFKSKETVYSFNAVPLGGFVSIWGENAPTADLGVELGDPRAMFNQPKLVQAAVLVAGVAANLILAWLLISLALSFGVPASAHNLPAGFNLTAPQLTVTSVLPDSPASRAGLKVGDVIASFNTVQTLQTFIVQHANQEITLFYTRGSDPTSRSAAMTPVDNPVEERATIGVGLDLIGTARVSWPLNLISGLDLTFNLTKVSLVGLWRVISDSIFAGKSLVASVVGPVGLAVLIGDARLFGLSYLLFFMAFISINLAIFNLIPFPALDGGRLLFLFLEAIKGSRLPAKVANAVNLAGFAILIFFILIITFHDLAGLF